MEVHVPVGRDDRARSRPERRRALDGVERGDVERGDAARAHDPHLLHVPLLREDDLEPRDEVLVVHRVGRREAVERLEEPVGEDRVNAVVHRVQVRGERDLRGVERGLVSGLHARDVVLDRAPPPLEARRNPRPAVLAPPPLAVGLALLAELSAPTTAMTPIWFRFRFTCPGPGCPPSPSQRHERRRRPRAGRSVALPGP